MRGKEAAEKVVEIAEIYAIYEAKLECTNAMAFGGLIRLATELIQRDDAVGAYIAGISRSFSFPLR